MKSAYKLNWNIGRKIVGDKNVNFAMLSKLFYTRTVHRESSGESNSIVAYSVLPMEALLKIVPLVHN